MASKPGSSPRAARVGLHDEVAGVPPCLRRGAASTGRGLLRDARICHLAGLWDTRGDCTSPSVRASVQLAADAARDSCWDDVAGRTSSSRSPDTRKP
jgi:hypothetical protein